MVWPRPLELRRWLDLALDDQGLDRVHLRDVRLRNGAADLADALSAVLQGEDEVSSALEVAGLDEGEELEGRVVDLLGAAREDVLAEVGLICVHADAPHGPLALVVRLRGIERAEATTTGDLEDRLRALADLVQGKLLALRREPDRELIRVGDQNLDLRIHLLGAGAIPSDPVVHGRELLAADSAQHLLAALLLGHQRGEIADEVTGLLGLE